MLCRKTSLQDAVQPAEKVETQTLYQQRQLYIQCWQKLEAHLLKRLGQQNNIHCFGAGGFTSLLAGYAPGLWKKVDCCYMDHPTVTQFHGKNLCTYDAAQATGATYVVATNPVTQDRLAKRLINDGAKAIIWCDIINC